MADFGWATCDELIVVSAVVSFFSVAFSPALLLQAIAKRTVGTSKENLLNLRMVAIVLVF
jgi:hypothetical protein